MREFKRLKRTLVHQGKIVSFYIDQMQTPGGKVVEWDFLDHKGAAAIIPVDDDGKILMVRQYRGAIDRFTLEIPAGGLDLNEDMQTCAVRELEEETGYKARKVSHLMDLITVAAYCNEKIGVYYATELIASKQHLDEDEFVNIERYTLDELVKMILNGEIQDSKTISSLLAYRAKIMQE